MARSRVLALTLAAVCLACVDRPASTAGSIANAASGPPPHPFAAHALDSGNPYTDRFLALWNDIHDPKSGYFSPQGIPYHAVETLLCEAPDYGHETTSEAYSYWIWLEAMYGRATKDWSWLDAAWTNMEAFIIPGALDQPTTAAYDASKPAQFAPELDQPNKYPAAFAQGVPVGSDPLDAELRATYGDANVYAMHWLIDVDDWYGFGRRGDGTSRPSFINTFQRGPEESVWETIPQPAWDDLKWGGAHGYLDLFVKDSDTAQWKYTVAPDADARAVQAVYWARRWAIEGGAGASVNGVVAKAAKLGDYLRYAMFDKYFKSIGCTSPNCAPGGGRSAAHFLVSWNVAWGGATPPGNWSWRIASSVAHSGYQNPMTAYALSSVPEMRPRSPTAWGDWARSLARQLELYRWLQSAEGGIAGGVTNSWLGAYAAPPPGTPTFYGMAYDASPVYRDPPSNEWFGFQAWSMERVAEYYYVSADERARALLAKWVAWVTKNSALSPDGGYSIPSTLAWSGAPSASWDAQHQVAENATLHVTVKESGDDVGTAASVSKALAFWAARSGDTPARALAKELLDRMWKKYRDGKGVAQKETRKDYKRFADPIVVPPGWKGKMPNGDTIDAQSTFVSIRSKYRRDPDWPRVDALLRGGEAPSFTYHRFWAQAEIATANATYGWLFP